MPAVTRCRSGGPYPKRSNHRRGCRPVREIPGLGHRLGERRRDAERDRRRLAGPGHNGRRGAQRTETQRPDTQQPDTQRPGTQRSPCGSGRCHCRCGYRDEGRSPGRVFAGRRRVPEHRRVPPTQAPDSPARGPPPPRTCPPGPARHQPHWRAPSTGPATSRKRPCPGTQPTFGWAGRWRSLS
jgi:hypothetical protein